MSDWNDVYWNDGGSGNDATIEGGDLQGYRSIDYKKRFDQPEFKSPPKLFRVLMS